MNDLFEHGLEARKLGVLDFSYEIEFGKGGAVAGVDEVGRGCLAGPVVAAAVVLDPNKIPKGLNDSKKLSAKSREILADDIKASALAWRVAASSVNEIDNSNILAASLLAMRRAVLRLPIPVHTCLVDGNQDPNLKCATHLVVKGDGKVLSIAAASILAKTVRDLLMKKLSVRHNGFDWDRNAGYGVPAHLRHLTLVGPTAHHRKSFAPIRKLILQEEA